MATAQPSLFIDTTTEDDQFLKQQIITYIGNKRSLLPFIESGIKLIKSQLGKDHVSFLDLFSGTGIVSRMARKHSRVIHCNDLEMYSEIANRCYQTNRSDIDQDALDTEINRVREATENDRSPGFIAELYAPKNDDEILSGERVFYTRRNAIFLDAFCRAITTTPGEIRPYLLAPILSQASIHANTSGVFKGFYKNKEGIGQFGGTSRNALTRIIRDIEVCAPIFSNQDCASYTHRQDANTFIRTMDAVDIAYFDPPYNQHPYGSNYFMLNLLCDYRRPARISTVSGIPDNWNRSKYNKPHHVEEVLFDAVEMVRASFVLISYNSEGFISRDRFLSGLSKFGKVSVMDTRYNTFRGCRNLADRNIYVTENLYLVDKR